AEDGIRDATVTGVQTCALPIFASHQNETPVETNRFHADLFWIVREPLRIGHFYDLRLATQEVKCQIVSIEQVMDSSTLEKTSDRSEERRVGKECRSGEKLVQLR